MNRFAVIGTLDTKGPETMVAKNLIESRGYRALIVDCGMMGDPWFAPDISSDEVAAAAGTTIEALRKAPKNDAIVLMRTGLENIVLRLYERNEISGILGLGGGQGTVMATASMQKLPFGFPKVMVSTVANGQQTFGPLVGSKDIAIIHSVADILGVNTITRTVIAKGVGSMLGMAEIQQEEVQGDKKTIGITSAGVTNTCVMRLRDLLEEKGYEVIAFHCNGIGAQAMEELAVEGRISGIIDLSPHDIADLLFGGIFPAPENRLEPPCSAGIPMVFVPGGLDFILHGAFETVPKDMLKRKYVRHNPLHTHVRAVYEEMKEMGFFAAERLAHNSAQVKIIIPLRGFTQLNHEGKPMYDPDADRGFLDGVKQYLNHHESGMIQIIPCDAHINDPEFSDLVAREMDALLAGEGDDHA